MSNLSHPDSTRAILFPGQGSQFVGMARDLFENETVARDMFEIASERMGRDLMALCAEGPQEVLNATDVCQPAIFVASLAATGMFFNDQTDVTVTIGTLVIDTTVVRRADLQFLSADD